MFKIPSIDIFSFWLGFIIASLFWWILSRFKNIGPAVVGWVKAQLEIARQRRLAGIGAYIRQDTFKRAQNAHLASALFSLEEILVPVHLLAPPSYLFHPEEPLVADTITGQVIPYLPDWPEVCAQYNYERLTAAQAVQKGANIAIIGQPGSGKTVCLAELAIHVARKDPEVAWLADFVPIFTHILDINLTLDDREDPIGNLIGLITARVPIFVAPRLVFFLRQLIQNGKVLLLIDGLDELPPDSLKNAVQFIEAITRKYPSIRIVVTASPDYMDGLTRISFHPLSVAPWKEHERVRWIRSWSTGWSQHIVHELKKHGNYREIDPDLMVNWMIGDSAKHSPMDWTLKIWSIFSGDSSTISNLNALEAYISRTTHKILPRPALVGAACEYIQHKKASLPFGELEQFFTGYSPTNDPGESTEIPESAGGNPNEAGEQPHPGKEKKVSSGARAIDRLLSTGILTERQDGQISFSHAIIIGYLASSAIEPSRVTELSETEAWLPAELTLRYIAAQNKITGWIKGILLREDVPLYRNTLLIARWLNDICPSAEWRTLLLRRLVDLIQQESTPFHIRAKMLGAFLISNDATIPLLLKQFLGSKSSALRLLGTIGAGAVQDAKVLDDLLGLFNDELREIRLAACMAVGVINTPNAVRALAETLLHADEDMRSAAAEILAADPSEGHAILKDALGMEDLLTRRAAVYGLACVHEDWAQPLLEKTAIEDSQWVVRNAAAQVLEENKKPDRTAPEPLPAPHEAPWLIKYASRQGIGIPAGDPATELIVKALENGNPSEQISALNYLVITPQDEIFGYLYKLLYQQTGPVQEAAGYALWLMVVSGVAIPSPRKYGL